MKFKLHNIKSYDLLRSFNFEFDNNFIDRYIFFLSVVVCTETFRAAAENTEGFYFLLRPLCPLRLFSEERSFTMGR